MPSVAHLHSSLSQERAQNWNVEAGSADLTIRCDSSTLITTLADRTGARQRWTDPLEALNWMATEPFPGADHRWVGYLSYDLGRLFEDLPISALDDLQLPLFCFSRIKSAPTSHAPEPCDKQQQSTTPLFNTPAAGLIHGDLFPHFESSLSKQDFLHRVSKAIDYIRAGDIFQVNLSQRLVVPQTLTAGQIWQNLLDRTPAAYGAFLDFGDHQIVSNSPELFLHIDSNRNVTTRPIKGTRARKPGMREALLHSAKDAAELNMIVDLERNDLGRVSRIGSVRVTQERTIESHPTVYHGVATVQGLLRPDVTFIDLLRATFPGGSITGAPKIRAMQIIEKLEPIRRGPYCGAIGYIAADGSMQFNVAIRTMIIKNQKVFLPVGGGIVADSDPLQEFEETLVKAAAMLQAIGASA